MKTKTIALAGNPNVGKSTVFNSLTGLNQHTGNWAGKTVVNAVGDFLYKEISFRVIDTPGVYSLIANTQDEEVARDYICFGKPDVTVVVADATCLERNLNLLLQVSEITKDIILCINFIDEANKKNITIDTEKLSRELGIPVILTAARSDVGVDKLIECIYSSVNKGENYSFIKIDYGEKIEEAIELIMPKVSKLMGNEIDSRWVSIKLLVEDFKIIDNLKEQLDIDILGDMELNDQLNIAKQSLFDNGITTEELSDMLVSRLVRIAEGISKGVITIENKKYNQSDRQIDKIITSKVFGIPIMLFIMGVVFWITIVGANYPSQLIAKFLFEIEDILNNFFTYIGTPTLLKEFLVMGVYRTLAWVISVMLPPMAIFFPLFTLLEDSGYLPRIAFNLDNFFKKACAHGKQALTMCMGFGCNAVGVIGCRIIDSPREKLIAIITNNFVPCNGRFPTLIAIISMFFIGTFNEPSKSLITTLLLTGIILIGILATFIISNFLSKTILKGIPSSFILELPPYRRPLFARVIVRSFLDRTIFVLGRAVMVAAPAGAIIWIMANINIHDKSLLFYCANFLDPIAELMGLDGFILILNP